MNGAAVKVYSRAKDGLTALSPHFKVREHNNFARRVPVLEEQMKVANHRIQDLEDAQK